MSLYSKRATLVQDELPHLAGKEHHGPFEYRIRTRSGKYTWIEEERYSFVFDDIRQVISERKHVHAPMASQSAAQVYRLQDRAGAYRWIEDQHMSMVNKDAALPW